MMDEKPFKTALQDLPLGGVRYYDQIGSTNDAALAWAAEGAPDLALVAADEQTAGRGRAGRTWYTPPGAALAFSLILRPKPEDQTQIALFSGLGALAVTEALRKNGFAPQIKWPNDVLLDRRKVCGILAETVWLGASVESVILGIGINVRAQAVPAAETLNFPATSLEEAAGRAIQRPALLHDILTALVAWRPRVGSEAFLKAWEDALAFRGEQVQVWAENGPIRAGQVEGLESDGSLRLKSPAGEAFSVRFGEVHLRPLV